MNNKPTTAPTISTSIRFPESWISELDKVSRKRDQSRNKVMGSFIRAGLDAFTSQERLRQKIEDSAN